MYKPTKEPQKGDEIVLILPRSRLRGIYDFGIVDRVTPKHVVLEDGRRFIRTSGLLHSAEDPMNSERLTFEVEPDEARERNAIERLRQERNRLTREIGQVVPTRWYDLNDEQLNQVANWLGLEPLP